MAGGVELATAYVTLVPSLKGAKGKIGEQVGPEGEKAGEGFSNSFLQAMGSLGGKIVSALAAIGVGKAVADLVRSSLDEYANYEQLVGGMQTLYGDAASTVMANAEQAFASAGMSANQYMETATSFSAALVRSVGGDTAEAARLADVAIRDMSDNANKMGTSIESIQDAYRGFARGNFMMLDNLSLGFNGTKEGMEQLLAEAERIQAANGNMVDYSIDSYADMVEAIHVVQNEMGITGTTANEAKDTIQGSLASAQAAWTNLITHLGDEEADFSALFDNLAESAGNVVRNIGTRVVVILTQMFDNVPSFASRFGEFLAPMVPAILEFAPQLIQSFTWMVLGLVDQLPYALPQMMAGATQLFQGILLALLQVAPQLVLGLADALAQLVMQLFTSIPSMLQTATELFNTIWQAIMTAGPTIISGLIDIIGQLLANILSAAPGVLANAGQMMGQLVVAIGNAAGQALPAIGGLLNQVLSAITSFDLLGAGQQLMQGFISGIQSMAGQIFDAAVGAVQGAVDGVLGFLGIASPSRLFREIGQYTMEGMAIGIERTAAEARAAMLGATSGVVGAAEMSIAATTEVGGMPAGVVYNVIFNDARVNDNEAIRAEVDAFVLDMVRRADQ